MQKFIIYIVLLLVSLPTMAQNETPQQREDGAYFYTDQAPEFPGGMAALNAYIKENLVYPQDAFKEGASGRVLVNFVIGEDGTVEKVKVTNSVHPALDQEAVRVVEGMPKWKPGKKDGKKVPVVYNVPISFNLKNAKPEFTGIWQLFSIVEQADGKNSVRMYSNMKIFKKDGTFYSIGFDRAGNAFFSGQGIYKITSDNTYTESIKKLVKSSVADGKDVELNYAFASPDILISSYQLPGSPLPSQETWKRISWGVPAPENPEATEAPQSTETEKPQQP